MWTIACVMVCLSAGAAHPAYSGAEWEQRAPERLGLDAAALDKVAETLGGRGCIVKNGYVVKTWGDQAQVNDWFSSAKPVLSTLLFFAMQEGLVKSVDQPIREFGWPLQGKDAGITFRHLGAMTSGYMRPEGPCEAWAYNDFAIQLYQMTLFDKVFKGDAKAVAEDPRRLGALQLQDGLKFNKKRRISASPRDFARICWFWLNRGRWGRKQVLDARYFDEFQRPQASFHLPLTQDRDLDDYLGIGSYGGTLNHFSDMGPGVYGFNWWFNTTGGTHPYAPAWPDAPSDLYMSLGAHGNSSVIIPSLGLVLVCAEGKWGSHEPGNSASPMNKLLKTLAQSTGWRRGPAVLAGAMRACQPVTLTFDGPEMSEGGTPNPFTDSRMDVTFSRRGQKVRVPGFFAADGNAAETGADMGNRWRVHFLTEQPGTWRYRVSFASDADVDKKLDGAEGTFEIAERDPNAPGFLSTGVLRHGKERYLRFAATREVFLKGGADSPENLLAYADFEGTRPTHKYAPHAGDWLTGDPFWRGDKGKSLVGALDYLAGKGMNSVYFLTMNVNGDGKDVWPWTADGERFRFDCGKLDQWEIIFSHMDRLGLMLHVVLQEQENDQLLDGGELGPERRLYHRELTARFAHHPALVWNLGEENTNTDAQRKAFAEDLRNLDPYDHPIVVHTFPSKIEEVYTPLLGFPMLDGPSVQLGHMEKTHKETLKWVQRSRDTGWPWFVCLDETGPADTGVKPDADDPDHDEVRHQALWGNLMAGGAGCEWLFGYKYAHNDINCEDWRSRDRMWDQTRYALEFFKKHIPFEKMLAADDVVAAGGAWCLAKPKKIYAVYAPAPAETRLNLPGGHYRAGWYDPRNGGDLVEGAVLVGGANTPCGTPPNNPDKDWVLLLERQ